MMKGQSILPRKGRLKGREKVARICSAPERGRMERSRLRSRSILGNVTSGSLEEDGGKKIGVRMIGKKLVVGEAMNGGRTAGRTTGTGTLTVGKEAKGREVGGHRAKTVTGPAPRRNRLREVIGKLVGRQHRLQVRIASIIQTVIIVIGMVAIGIIVERA